MTHEELLEKIRVFLVATELQSIDENFEGTKMLKALRAVVELHKPSDPTWDDGFVCCEICNYEYDRNEPYPCKTIQLIEKNLL